MNNNSMLYWWPLVKDLDIPMPATEIVEIGMPIIVVDSVEAARAVDKSLPGIVAAVRKLGLPAFLRTDYTSGKHEWKKTCYLTEHSVLKEHLCELFEYSGLCDLVAEAIVVREYIPMASKFTAFNGTMPVNPERRYFVQDGAVVCHHQYWIEEAIAEWESWPKIKPSGLPSNWKELAREMNTETADEVALLTGYAIQIANAVDGYWSVDFCKAADGRWIFIDMAEGNRSWHPDCPHLLDFS